MKGLPPLPKILKRKRKRQQLERRLEAFFDFKGGMSKTSIDSMRGTLNKLKKLGG